MINKYNFKKYIKIYNYTKSTLHQTQQSSGGHQSWHSPTDHYKDGTSRKPANQISQKCACPTIKCKTKSINSKKRTDRFHGKNDFFADKTINGIVTKVTKSSFMNVQRNGNRCRTNEQIQRLSVDNLIIHKYRQI